MRQPFCRDGRVLVGVYDLSDPLREQDLGECEDCHGRGCDRPAPTYKVRRVVRVGVFAGGQRHV